MLGRLGMALSALGLVTGGLALGTPAQAQDVRGNDLQCGQRFWLYLGLVA
jgi:hypothetical protein